MKDGNCRRISGIAIFSGVKTADDPMQRIAARERQVTRNQRPAPDARGQRVRPKPLPASVRRRPRPPAATKVLPEEPHVDRQQRNRPGDGRPEFDVREEERSGVSIPPTIRTTEPRRTARTITGSRAQTRARGVMKQPSRTTTIVRRGRWVLLSDGTFLLVDVRRHVRSFLHGQQAAGSERHVGVRERGEGRRLVHSCFLIERSDRPRARDDSTYRWRSGPARRDRGRRRISARRFLVRHQARSSWPASSATGIRTAPVLSDEARPTRRSGIACT